MKVKLLELTENNNHPFGNVLGREVFKRLQNVVDSNHGCKSFEISLEGIVATDSSFHVKVSLRLQSSFVGKSISLSPMSAQQISSITGTMLPLQSNSL